MCPMCPHLGNTEDVSAHGRSPQPLWGHWGQHRFASWLLPCASLTCGKQKQSLGLRSGSGSSTWSPVFPSVLPSWKTVAIVCSPESVFFSLSHFIFVPFRLLLSDGNVRNQVMAPSEHSRCPQTRLINMFNPHASDRGVFLLKIDYGQCHFPRTVIYRLITSGYSFPSEKFLEVLFCFLPLFPFFKNFLQSPALPYRATVSVK